MKESLLVFTIAIFMVGCGAPKSLTTSKTDAESFEGAGNYTAALAAWENYFEHTETDKIDGATYSHAAKTAYKSGHIEQALSWFDQARYKNYADAEMYILLSEIFREKKNISKELNALEYIAQNFKDEAAKTDNRLFDVYVEIGSIEQALQVWERLDEDLKGSQEKLEHYFLINKSLKDTTVCDSVSLALLDKNPQNVEALEWQAIKYYWKGENHYQQEMARYEKNKTSKQYRILLKELDKATADFKKSLAYFEKLWEVRPGEKYASYFANIYSRFGDKKRSLSYQKYLK